VPELQYNYSYQLADMYRRTGKVSKMQDEFLNSLIKSEKRMKRVKTIFQRELDKEGYTMLQTKLYERMTEQPKMEIFPEMLMWTFITQKQYDKALRQARALDRQFEENGGRVFDIAEIALDDNYYDTAIKGFEYITTKKGINTSYYLEAKRGLLKAKRFKITKDYSYTQEDLLALEAEYILFMAEYGRNSQTVLLMQEYAELQAIYMNDIDEAIEVLEELIGFAGVEKYALNQSKINLADYKLIQGDIWESTLLYSQVDKEFKEASIGEEARYRNAKLSYYIGDFEWAQEQFDILKRATSKLISNDAIDKAVFIMDNMALDTTDAPLKMYSGSELLIFQNRFEEAQTKLDSITTIYPEHSLEDDVFYSKAQIHMKKREYQDAIGFYEKIIEKYPEEIRADNALFEMAQLFELILEDKVKALELYEKLFLQYSGSTFSVEARKRFRILRGDEI
jgi:tetratricopeptide (TPR) repeat protein